MATGTAEISASWLQAQNSLTVTVHPRQININYVQFKLSPKTFYSASAQLAMQSAVLAMIDSV